MVSGSKGGNVEVYIVDTTPVSDDDDDDEAAVAVAVAAAAAAAAVAASVSVPMVVVAAAVAADERVSVKVDGSIAYFCEVEMDEYGSDFDLVVTEKEDGVKAKANALVHCKEKREEVVTPKS